MQRISRGRLDVEITEPGERYSGSRFDWTGFVAQITLDGKHTFCGSESEVEGVGSFWDFLGASETVFYLVNQTPHKREVAIALANGAAASSSTCGSTMSPRGAGWCGKCGRWWHGTGARCRRWPRPRVNGRENGGRKPRDG